MQFINIDFINKVNVNLRNAKWCSLRCAHFSNP